MYNILQLASAISDADDALSLVRNVLNARGYLYGEVDAIATACSAADTDIIVYGTHKAGAQFVMVSLETITINPTESTTDWPKVVESQPQPLTCLGFLVGGGDARINPLISALEETLDTTTKGDYLAHALGYDTWVVVGHGNVPQADRPTITTKVVTGTLKYSFRNSYDVTEFTRFVASNVPQTTGGHIYGWDDRESVTHFVRDRCFVDCDDQNFDDLQTVYLILLHQAVANNHAAATNAVADEAELRVAADAALLTAFEGISVFGNTVKSVLETHANASQYIPRP